MNYELRTTKAKRTCTPCSGVITKGTKFVEKTMWIPGRPYPLKENMCMECADSYAKPDFLKYLRELVKKLEQLQTQIGGI